AARPAATMLPPEFAAIRSKLRATSCPPAVAPNSAWSVRTWMIDHDPPPSSDRRRYTFGGGGVMSVLITLPQAHYSGGGRFPAHVEVGELTPYVQEGDFVSGVKVPGGQRRRFGLPCRGACHRRDHRPVIRGVAVGQRQLRPLVHEVRRRGRLDGFSRGSRTPWAILRSISGSFARASLRVTTPGRSPSLLLLPLRGWCTSTSRRTSAPNAFQASRSTPSPIQIHQRFRCAAGKIRTCYPRLRRPVLYPDELQPRT